MPLRLGLEHRENPVRESRSATTAASRRIRPEAGWDRRDAGATHPFPHLRIEHLAFALMVKVTSFKTGLIQPDSPGLAGAA